MSSAKGIGRAASMGKGNTLAEARNRGIMEEKKKAVEIECP
jgi:hypothetical protein